ncbi:MAG: DUF502 domain-containing protein [Nitrospinae bacterium]|nr:DUF502 domain-containing protein [Nitrospinota bacterium]
MSEPSEKPLLKRAQSYFVSVFLAGVLVTLPLAISVIIIRFLFNTVDNLLTPAVTQILIMSGASLATTYKVPGLGFVATILIVFLMGLITRNFIGRKLLNFGENLLVKIPIFRSVYTGAKQVIDTFSASSSMAFGKVALIEYPRKGVYTLAFITSEGKGEIVRRLGREMINLYVPTTPNPTSGFFLSLPKEDVVELDMPVEDGFKMVISSGLIIPTERGDAKPHHVG